MLQGQVQIQLGWTNLRLGKRQLRSLMNWPRTCWLCRSSGVSSNCLLDPASTRWTVSSQTMNAYSCRLGTGLIQLPTWPDTRPWLQSIAGCTGLHVCLLDMGSSYRCIYFGRARNKLVTQIPYQSAPSCGWQQSLSTFQTLMRVESWSSPWARIVPSSAVAVATLQPSSKCRPSGAARSSSTVMMWTGSGTHWQ